MDDSRTAQRQHELRREGSTTRPRTNNDDGGVIRTIGIRKVWALCVSGDVQVESSGVPLTGVDVALVSHGDGCGWG